MENEETHRVVVRMPIDMAIELKVMAARNLRSVNAQMVLILQEAIDKAKNEKSGTTA